MSKSRDCRNRCVVTGVAGFVGSRLAERLVQQGSEVIGIDGFTDSYDINQKRENLDNLTKHLSFSFVEGHLSELSLSKMLCDVDDVFHMAARAGVRGGWGKPFDAYYYDNLLSTQRLLEALRESPPARRLVFASTSSVYGYNPPLPTPESAETNPESYYAVTKLACENLINAYGRHFGIPSTILRFYSLYGPGQRPDMGFHIFMRALLSGEEIIIYGDGEQTREVTYIDDAIEAILSSVQVDSNESVINVGGGHHDTLNNYLQVIEKVTGMDFVRRYVEPVKGDQLHSHADITRAREILNYTPTTSLEEGLKAEFEWIIGRTGQNS